MLPAQKTCVRGGDAQRASTRASKKKLETRQQKPLPRGSGSRSKTKISALPTRGGTWNVATSSHASLLEPELELPVTKRIVDASHRRPELPAGAHPGRWEGSHLPGVRVRPL